MFTCDELAKIQSKVNVTLKPMYLFIKQQEENDGVKHLSFFK